MTRQTDNEGVLVFEEGVVADGAGVGFLEGFLGDAVELYTDISNISLRAPLILPFQRFVASVSAISTLPSQSLPPNSSTRLTSQELITDPLNLPRRHLRIRPQHIDQPLQKPSPIILQHPLKRICQRPIYRAHIAWDRNRIGVFGVRGID